MEIRTNPDKSPDFTFLNACILVKTSLINTKLGDLGNIGVLFLTMGINMNVVPRCYAAQHSYVPSLSLRRDSPSKIVPDFLCATL